MRTRSLSTRLLASVSVLLIIFFGITIFALDVVFTNASLNAIRTRLEVQVYGLISASDEHPGGQLLPGDSLAEARFNNPGSGLYGQIARGDGQVLWNSPSMTGIKLDLRAKLEPGKRIFREYTLPDGSSVLALSLGFQWEFANRRSRAFIFSAAENLEPFNAELQNFRKQLFAWFGGLMLLLLGALALVFRWVLQPVRKVEREIGEIEAGRRTEFGDGYPRELVGITTNMNALLRNEHQRLTRYRNTLGNLAHSLKTPLAVIRNLITTPELRAIDHAKQLDVQVERMDDIVRYQLKRAAMSGGTSLGNAPVVVAKALEPLRATLRKVYSNKDLSIEFDIQPDVQFTGDQGDLLEIAGNLLDNACKWCRERVRLTARVLQTPGTRREGVVLCVEDDGPGIKADERTHVLERGARLDERVSGQGIGLSVVQELAALSEGAVEIDQSNLGGARITVRLPAL